MFKDPRKINLKMKITLKYNILQQKPHQIKGNIFKEY